MADVEQEHKLDRVGFWLMVRILFVATFAAITLGYDNSMINGLQILPSYFNYFGLDTATTGLNVSILYIGSVVAFPFTGWLSDKWGRKWGMAITALTAIAGTIIQGAAVHEAMFCLGRFLVGMSVTMGSTSATTYIAEVAHPRYRTKLVGIYGAMFFVGSLIAAVVTFGSQFIEGNWSWRLPSLLQLLPSALSLLPLPWIPESPRWLIYQDRQDEAKALLIKYHGGGDINSPIGLMEYNEICQALAFEKSLEETEIKALFATKGNRWRFGITALVAVGAMLTGVNIITYYLGAVLDTAGITDTQTQLAINIGLSVWNLICATMGSLFFDKVGRRPAFLWSTTILGLLLIINTIITKLYSGFDNVGASAAMVTIIFLFFGVYSSVWTPGAYLYPVEVLSYSLRANGLSVYSGMVAVCGVFITYVSPYGMEIPWLFYMISGLFCFFLVGLMWIYFPETKNSTLEEIDVIFDGEGRNYEDVKTL